MADEPGVLPGAVAEPIVEPESTPVDTGPDAVTQPEPSEATPEEPTSEAPTEPQDVLDSAEDGSETGQQRESRKQREERRRAEAEAQRKAEDDARIARQVAAELERINREAEEKRKAEEAAAKQRQEFQQYLGADEELDQLRARANAPLPELPDDPYSMDQESYARLKSQRDDIASARQQLSEYEGRRGMLSKLAQDIQAAERAEALAWISTEVRKAGDIEDVGTEFLSASNPYDLIKRVRDSVASNVEQRFKEKIADLEDTIAELEAERDGESTHRAGRTATAERAAPVGGNRNMTREEFMRLPWEQRQRLRSEQPALVDRIYATG